MVDLTSVVEPYLRKFKAKAGCHRRSFLQGHQQKRPDAGLAESARIDFLEGDNIKLFG